VKDNILISVVVAAVLGALSRDDDDVTSHLPGDDQSQQTDDVLTDSLLGIVPICSGLAYESLKTGLVDYHCARIGYSDCRNHSQSTLSYSHSNKSRSVK